MNRYRCIQLLFGITIIIFTFSADYLVRHEIARTFSNFTDRFIKLGDFREVALIINGRFDNTFTAVELVDSKGTTIFHLPPEHAYASFFEGKIKIQNASTGKSLVFWYDLWLPTILSTAILIVIAVLAKLWSRARENQIRMLMFMEKRIEIANLLTQVSHDIRSPLSALNLAVSGVKGIDSDRQDLITNASKRINAIADALLQRTKSDAPKEPQPISVSEVIRLILTEKKFEYDSRNVDLTALLPPEDVKARIDATDLGCTISNLINNSVEAGATQVQIELYRKRSKMEILVQDNGPGIPKTILRRLGREPISSGQGRKSGYGVGLWSAYLFAQRSKGKLKVRNSGRGTAVLLTFQTNTQ
ncbi:MAG: sensor histidine kinase [Bdellovibrionales bacterium]